MVLSLNYSSRTGGPVREMILKSIRENTAVTGVLASGLTPEIRVRLSLQCSARCRSETSGNFAALIYYCSFKFHKEPSYAICEEKVINSWNVDKNVSRASKCKWTQHCSNSIIIPLCPLMMTPSDNLCQSGPQKYKIVLTWQRLCGVSNGVGMVNRMGSLRYHCLSNKAVKVWQGADNVFGLSQSTPGWGGLIMCLGSPILLLYTGVDNAFGLSHSSPGNGDW